MVAIKCMNTKYGKGRPKFYEIRAMNIDGIISYIPNPVPQNKGERWDEEIFLFQL